MNTFALLPAVLALVLALVLARVLALVLTLVLLVLREPAAPTQLTRPPRLFYLNSASFIHAARRAAEAIHVRDLIKH